MDIIIVKCKLYNYFNKIHSQRLTDSGAYPHNSRHCRQITCIDGSFLSGHADETFMRDPSRVLSNYYHEI